MFYRFGLNSRGKTDTTQQDKNNKELVEKIDKQIASIDDFFVKLEGIYAAERKDALLVPLQEEIAQEGQNKMTKNLEATRLTVESIESSSAIITELSQTIGKIS